MTAAEEKAALRRELRRKSRALDAAYRAEADRAIRAHILSSPVYRQAKTVFAYLGVDWEIDTAPLLRQILADGKVLCLPRCVAAHEMTLHIIVSFDELSPGAYGIPEPPETAPRLGPSQIDLALIPCVAADRTGRRLGQGGGYYDAFLRRYRGASLLLCRESAVCPAIPTEEHDVFLPILVTETGIFPVSHEF